jgi:hypothetical protein
LASLVQPCPSSGNRTYSTTPAVLLDRRDDLLGFDSRHARVVRSLKDEERRADPVRLVERRDRVEEIRVGGGIAILRGSQTDAIGGGFAQEALEARDSVGVDGGRPEIGIERDGGERHVAAVGSAHDRDPVGIDQAGLLQPRHAGDEILDGVLPPAHVIQVRHRPSVSRRAPHVGHPDGIATANPELDRRVEGGPRL